MKLEDQVVSLDLSKKLKELGVRQESYAYWVEREYDPGYVLIPAEYYACPCDIEGHSGCDIREIAADTEGKIYDKEAAFAAFTVAELGEMLPARIKEGWLSCDKCSSGEDFQGDGTWICCYGKIEEGKDHNCFEAISGNTEADARAKMLIYLIEQKLTEVR